MPEDLLINRCSSLINPNIRKIIGFEAVLAVFSPIDNK
jgi:hypothetical protein